MLSFCLLSSKCTLRPILIIYTLTDLASLVAVYGLGGDAIDTWIHLKSNAFWLKDFLPQRIPDACVMTFGYNAAAAFRQSTAEVIDYAKSVLSGLIDKRDEVAAHYGF
jgi:hypothetical protein